MITSVCLNPAIDRTVSVPALEPGALNRVTASRSDAGGKGVNVAVTLARLGEKAACLAFLPRENGRLVEEKLKSEGVEAAGVALEGAIRTNLKVLDESKGEITEINESGAPVNAAQLRDMAALIERRAEKSEFLVLSGSLPPGCPASFYREIMERVARFSCRVALDADAARLREGLKARPFLIKPNRHELMELTGQPLPTLADTANAARALIEGGVKLAAVSMGGEGALIVSAEEALFAPRVDVTARSTVGAGDAMIAGLTAGLRRGLPLMETFRLGVACATASVMSEGTGLIDRADVDALLPRVQIIPVSEIPNS
ncbi:MAG: 1-phosphofructokinase [Clostridia bacterium]|nr:1-phosphofructokinase [Clostridia bacterium]